MARRRRNNACFPRKGDMLSELEGANLHITERCTSDATGHSYESVNHKYGRDGRRGRKPATTIREAMRIASPTTKPYCLDAVDLDVLNRVDCAKGTSGFRLPVDAQDAITAREWAAHYQDQARALEDAAKGAREREPGEDDDDELARAAAAGGAGDDFDFPPPPSGTPATPATAQQGAQMAKKKRKQKTSAAPKKPRKKKRRRVAKVAAPATPAKKKRKKRRAQPAKPRPAKKRKAKALPFELRVRPKRLRKLIPRRRFATHAAAESAMREAAATLTSLRAKGWDLGVYG